MLNEFLSITSICTWNVLSTARSCTLNKMYFARRSLASWETLCDMDYRGNASLISSLDNNLWGVRINGRILVNMPVLMILILTLAV